MKNVLPSEDIISLKTDTFHIDADTVKVDRIPLKNASNVLLLGFYTDSVYGRTDAEILTQLNCPTDWSFSPDTVAGSVKLVLLLKYDYSSIVLSDSNDVVTISAYEMNLATLDLPSPSATTYYSDIDPALYCDKTDTLGVFKDTIENIKNNGSAIEIPLSNTLRDKLISESVNNPSYFSSDISFINNLFKGIYITLESEIDKKAIFAITAIEMGLKYEYTNSAGSVIPENKVFAASKEVRKVNRITHNYTGYLPTIPPRDSVVFINAPAGINVEVTIPLKKMKDSLGITTNNGIAYLGNKKLSVNNCLFKVETTDNLPNILSPPTYLLMIKKSKKAAFFANSELPDNVSSMFAIYNSTTKSYSFDLREYLAYEFKSASMPDFEEFELVPVYATLSNGTPVSVSHSIGLYGATLRTKDSVSPLKLNVFISGF